MSAPSCVSSAHEPVAKRAAGTSETKSGLSERSQVWCVPNGLPHASHFSLAAPEMVMARIGSTTVVVLFAWCFAALASCAHDASEPNTPRAPAASVAFDKGPGKGSGSARDPDFLHAAADAPAIANPVIVFTAVRGRDTTVRMVYQHSRHGGGGDDLFAEFRVDARSLVFRPDGRAIADGESIQITMRLVDAVHGIIDFQPSGLRFSARDPARLKISYAHTDPDINGDGMVDARDTALRRGLHLICRETPTSPWTPVPSVNDSGNDVVDAPILGFSGYAIEY